MTQNEIIQQMILDGIKKAQEKGIELVYGTWGDDLIRACALTCLIPDEYCYFPSIAEVTESLRPILGNQLTEEWVTNFTLGFDGEDPPHGTEGNEPDAYIMGARIREITNPSPG